MTFTQNKKGINIFLGEQWISHRYKSRVINHSRLLISGPILNWFETIRAKKVLFVMGINFGGRSLTRLGRLVMNTGMNVCNSLFPGFAT
ncbi:hypothetical protein CW304_00780 [Bacillus sp. UFRGS-B20]|nr:hypothetical protein CW304_00780 [Bacillus sp. UFRGS-B20]